MAEVISADVSEFQVRVDDSYPHRWLSFRICDGDYLDAHASGNLAWSVNARATGRLDGFTVYVVYRPGANAAILAHLDEVSVPNDCVVMIDAETWSGQITGDHSGELNALADALAARQGAQSRVWGYGNRNDLATLWPGRPSWLGVVVASYGGTRPWLTNTVGWQYTDGQYDVLGYPSSTPPFGLCDHNVFYLTDTATDTAVVTPLATAASVTTSEEDEMYDIYQIPVKLMTSAGIVVPPNAGRVFLVPHSDAAVAFWASMDDIEVQTRFGRIANPGAPKSCLQADIDKLNISTRKGLR